MFNLKSNNNETQLLDQRLKRGQLTENIKGTRWNSSLKVLISFSCCLFLPFFTSNGSCQLARNLLWDLSNEKSSSEKQSSAESSNMRFTFLINITKYSGLHSFSIKLNGTRSRRAWVEPDNLQDYFKVLKLVGFAFTWFGKQFHLTLKNWEESEIWPYLQAHKLVGFSFMGSRIRHETPRSVPKAVHYSQDQQ